LLIHRVELKRGGRGYFLFLVWGLLIHRVELKPEEEFLSYLLQECC